MHAGFVADADPRVTRLGRLGLTQFRRGLPRGVVPISDDDLAALTTPTLLLLAEHSEIHRSRTVLARAETNMQSVEAEIVPGTAHTLPLERPELVGKRMRAFVETVSA